MKSQKLSEGRPFLRKHLREDAFCDWPFKSVQETKIFVEFLHGLLQQHLPGMEICVVSDWHNFKDRHAADYYRYFLAFFVCHGVLFENFVTNEEESVFYNSVVFPAMAEVTERFGVKPLIVPAIAEEKLQDEYWWCYPAHIVELKHYE